MMNGIDEHYVDRRYAQLHRHHQHHVGGQDDTPKSQSSRHALSLTQAGGRQLELAQNRSNITAYAVLKANLTKKSPANCDAP
ncbi:MAG: hypothetical protein ACRCVV_03105 [Shewanella sp.]